MMAPNEERSASLVENLHRAQQETENEFARTSPTETIAMIACVSALVQRFYESEAHISQPPVRGGVAHGAIEHRVIGGTSTALSAPALNEFLQETLRTGVS